MLKFKKILDLYKLYLKKDAKYKIILNKKHNR